MDPHAFRSERDLVLSKAILSDSDVRLWLTRLEWEEKKLGTRRALLAQALRLTDVVAPDIHSVLRVCCETLSVEQDVELYVFPSPVFNAACARPEGGRVFVLLSSALMEGFDPEELRFVVGHELGHHLFSHHNIPTGVLLTEGAGLEPQLLLQIHAWQRYAEISADRAGLLCSGGLQGGARALFKLSSGLRAAPNPERIQAFLEQAEELYRENELSNSADRAPRSDWLASHPFSPVRLKAAQAFANSEAFDDEGIPLTQVETEVSDLMVLMEPSYLEEKTEAAEAMRRLLFAAGVVVAAATDSISSDEIRVLESLMGPGRVPREPDVDRVRAHLSTDVEKVKELVERGRRAQLIRDLVAIARADNEVDEIELSTILEVCAALEVDPGVVHQAVSQPTDLD